MLSKQVSQRSVVAGNNHAQSLRTSKGVFLRHQSLTQVDTRLPDVTVQMMSDGNVQWIDGTRTSTVKKSAEAMWAEEVAQQWERKEVKAGKFTWSYRENMPTEDAGFSPLIMVHGIASNSFVYNGLLDVLAKNGVKAYAIDWLGHGFSSKPTPGEFAYDEESFITELKTCVDAIGISGPYNFVTQGYILGQYGLCYALKEAKDIDRMIILNTPLASDTIFREEIAKYKNPVPFMRPKPEEEFPVRRWHAYGSYLYARNIPKDIDEGYGGPYDGADGPKAYAALYHIMDKVDYKGLLNRVDSMYRRWKKPTMVLFGDKDPFCTYDTAQVWLETKRTNCKYVTVEGKLGHTCQEDNPAVIGTAIMKFLEGGYDKKIKKEDIMIQKPNPHGRDPRRNYTAKI